MRSKKELLERGLYWLERMRSDGFPIADDVTVVVDSEQKKCFAYCHKNVGQKSMKSTSHLLWRK